MIRNRTMSVTELAMVLDWAAAEGWNPGRDDAAAFHAADSGGFFLAEKDGMPVAAISVVNHTDDFAFLGLYLCLPEFRGQGIGFDLWRHALDHAGTRTVGLDGVPDQQANYARSGFEMFGKTVRYQGTVPAQTASAVRPARADEIERLVAMEAAVSGVRKPAYLEAWFQSTDRRQTLVFEGAGGVEGAATVRACREGAKIGPLMAASPEVATALIAHGATLYGGPVVVDAPSTSPELDALCRDLGLTAGFETGRMYRGPTPRPGKGIFGVTTLELG